MSCLPEDRTYCKNLSLYQKLPRISKQSNSKGQDVKHLHNQSQDNSSTSSVEEYLHSVFELGNSSRKFIVTVVINGISVDMEADLGAKCTTVPWSVFQEKLLCKCNSTSVFSKVTSMWPVSISSEGWMYSNSTNIRSGYRCYLYCSGCLNLVPVIWKRLDVSLGGGCF